MKDEVARAGIVRAIELLTEVIALTTMPKPLVKIEQDRHAHLQEALSRLRDEMGQ